ncbi:hypothetical protein V866_002752 [Kwoniella sp. B9012]
MQKRTQYRNSTKGSTTNTNTANRKWYNNPNIVSKTLDGSSIILLNDTQFTIKHNKGHSFHEDNADTDTDTVTDTDTLYTWTSTEPEIQDHSQVITLLKGTEWWAPSLGGTRHVHLPSNSSASRINPPFTPSRFKGYNYWDNAKLILSIGIR